MVGDAGRISGASCWTAAKQERIGTQNCINTLHRSQIRLLDYLVIEAIKLPTITLLNKFKALGTLFKDIGIAMNSQNNTPVRQEETSSNRHVQDNPTHIDNETSK